MWCSCGADVVLRRPRDLGSRLLVELSTTSCGAEHHIGIGHVVLIQTVACSTGSTVQPFGSPRFVVLTCTSFQPPATRLRFDRSQYLTCVSSCDPFTTSLAGSAWFMGESNVPHL